MSILFRVAIVAIVANVSELRVSTSSQWSYYTLIFLRIIVLVDLRLMINDGRSCVDDAK